MKECHQELEVTDMSGVKEEMRSMRMMEATEVMGSAGALGGGGGGSAPSFSAPTMEDEETYIRKKFVGATSKGMVSKVKAMRKKC